NAACEGEPGGHSFLGATSWAHGGEPWAHVAQVCRSGSGMPGAGTLAAVAGFGGLGLACGSGRVGAGVPGGTGVIGLASGGVVVGLAGRGVVGVATTASATVGGD